MASEAALGFVTLFLGLVVGPQNLELLVEDPVERVEIRLDGAEVALLSEAPWSTRIDFGPVLEPQDLEVIGRDAGGQVVGHILQSVNRPRELAEADLVIDRSGPRLRASLTWRAGGLSKPRAVRIRLDGRELDVVDPHDFLLPPLDERSLHFLRAEVQFTETMIAQAEHVFGGTFRDEVEQELTAIVLRGRKRLPKLSQLEGHLHGPEGDLRAVATERGAAEVMVVRSPTAETISELKGLFLASQSDRLRRGQPGFPTAPPPRVLPDGSRLQFVFPSATTQKVAPGVLDEVVPVTADVAPEAGGELETLLADTFFPEREAPATSGRLADAVAIAGIRAAVSERPRLVLLLTDGRLDDTSSHGVEEVRRFLELLRVPLVVARVSRRKADDGWDKGTYVSSVTELRSLCDELVRQLDRQVVVWVDGRVAPEDVEVSAKGLETLGTLR